MAFSLQLCRLPIRTDAALPENFAGIRALRYRRPLSVRCDADASSSSPSVAVDSDFDAKVFRKNLTRSDNYNRKGFGHKEETLALMDREYTSESPLNFTNWGKILWIPCSITCCSTSDLASRGQKLWIKGEKALSLEFFNLFKNKSCWVARVYLILCWNCRWYHKDSQRKWIWVYVGRCYCETGGSVWILLGSWAGCSDCLWSEKAISRRENMDNQWNYSQPNC